MRDGLRVLIVDDDKGIRDVLSDVLGREPEFQLVGQAEDGEQAMGLAMELRPDLVLMDIAMPRCNGFEAIRKIRIKSPRTKVILLSAQSEALYELAARSYGADGFIAKKRLGTELLPTIQRVLSKRETH